MAIEVLPVAGISLAAGVPLVLSTSFGQSARITRICLTRSDGGVTGSPQITLYSRLEAAMLLPTPPLAGSDAAFSLHPGGLPLPLTGNLPPESLQVTPTLTGAAGRLLWFAEGDGAGAGYPFANRYHAGNNVANDLRNRLFIRLLSDVSGLYALAISGERSPL